MLEKHSPDHFQSDYTLASFFPFLTKSMSVFNPCILQNKTEQMRSTQKASVKKCGEKYIIKPFVPSSSSQPLQFRGQLQDRHIATTSLRAGVSK